tara:strand:- start:83 stop:1252 length:1170 start_codon:yes stop_codon:yes gene_type:complete
MVHKPGHNSPIGNFDVNLPFQSPRFTNQGQSLLGPTQEYRQATGQMTDPSLLAQQINAPQTRVSNVSKTPTQTDISSLIGTTGNTEIGSLSENLAATLDAGSKKDEGFFGKLSGVVSQFSDNIGKPGFMEALVMHNTALKGGDITDILLAGVKVRNKTKDRLFKAAYNNAQLDYLKERTEASKNPKAAATKQVTGDDGFKYTVGADGSYSRTFPDQEKPVETAKAETEKSPFPKGYNLNNVTKSVETYIKGTYFPEEMTSGTGYKVDKSLQSQIATAAGQIANEIAPLISTMGLNAAIKTTVDKYEKQGIFQQSSPELREGGIFGFGADVTPAVDPNVDLDTLQSGITIPKTSEQQEQYIGQLIKANPGLTREQVIAEINKLIQAGKLK